MGYKTILVGTDGSETARLAERTAARLAKRTRATLLIVTGFEMERTTRERAHQVLAEARDRARELVKIEAETAIEEGAPADILLSVAERRDVDLIVLGNKGMGKATRFVLGPVPDRVAHAAPCDVLIVNTTKSLETGLDWKGYHTMLIGTDGSPTASEAARKGFELALMMGADATLVHVGDPMVGAIMLERTREAAPDGVEVATVQEKGDPAERICTVAERDRHDLIVVGNKGMAGTRRFLLAAVPNEVAHRAPTDVLIAKTVGLSLEDVAPGHGGVVDAGGKRVAVYRDEEGAVHAISPRCTHMGCTVDWNGAERTWDCPCHGSRYDTGGKVLRGPATKDLPTVEV